MMKKVMSICLVLSMIIGSTSMLAFADEQENLLGGSLNYNRPDKRFACEVVLPQFKPDPISDNNEQVYCSSQGKFKLDLNSYPDFSDKAYISIRIEEPKMKRCWKTVNPKRFGRKIVETNPNRNSFKIKGPLRQTEWWNLKNRLKYLIAPQTIDINYAIILTTKEEEEILETKEVKEGEKKRELINEDNFLDKIKEINPKEFSLNDPRRDERYIFRRDQRVSALKESYYTKEEANKFNKDLRLKKARVFASFAGKSGKDLITSGEVAQLSTAHPEQTFRLIINNNMGNGEATKLSMMLSNYENYKFKENDNNDNLELKFKPTYVRPLPAYLKTGCIDDKLSSAVLDMKEATNKLNFFETLDDIVKKCIPDVIKDLTSDFKELASKSREKKNNSLNAQTALQEDVESGVSSQSQVEHQENQDSQQTEIDATSSSNEESKSESRFRKTLSSISSIFRRRKNNSVNAQTALQEDVEPEVVDQLEPEHQENQGILPMENCSQIVSIDDVIE